MTDPVAHLGAVPGAEAAESDDAAVPVAPVPAYLQTANEIVEAFHAGEIAFLGEPLGWQEWLSWRAVDGHRDPATARISRFESQLWQRVMAELFGDGWSASCAPSAQGQWRPFQRLPAWSSRAPKWKI